MNSLVSKVLRRLGFSVSRVETTPFEYLKGLPRYEDTTVTLLDRPFRVADPLSFYFSHREIFKTEIYRFASQVEAPVIVDCGANHGTSIIYFKQLHPRAKITGVEADPRIFERLAWNVGQRGYSDVTLINKAISSETGPVKIFHEGADAGRTHFMAGAKATFEVEPIRLDSLIAQRTDFLKMDIEGAETEAICTSEKLGNVAQLFIEYHSFADTAQNLDALLRKLSTSGFRYYIQTQFCAARPLLSAECQLGMDLQLNIFASRAGERVGLS